jgi:hypothetical protein
MTIDHTEAALEQIEIATNATGLFIMNRATALAQVHATLALAKQTPDETVRQFMVEIMNRAPQKGNTYQLHAATMLEIAAKFGVTK